MSYTEPRRLKARLCKPYFLENEIAAVISGEEERTKFVSILFG